MSALQQRKSILNQDVLVLAPISKDDEGSLEQTYTLLKFSNEKFEVILPRFNFIQVI